MSDKLTEKEYDQLLGPVFEANAELLAEHGGIRMDAVTVPTWRLKELLKSERDIIRIDAEHAGPQED